MRRFIALLPWRYNKQSIAGQGVDENGDPMEAESLS
jgi:hypothetical protein